MFLKTIALWLQKVVHTSNIKMQLLLPIATGIVQKIKFLDDILGDTLAIIVGGLAPAMQAKIKELLPKVLLELQLVQSLTEVTTAEQINTVLGKLWQNIQGPDAPGREKTLTQLAASILQQLHEGKLTFAEAVVDVEYYYQSFVVSSNP